MNRFILCFIQLYCFSFYIFAQEGSISGTGTLMYGDDGSVTVTGHKIFTSYIADTNSNIDYMMALDAIGLFGLNADLSGGIKANVRSGGKVTVTLYSYSSETPNHIGSMLYQVYANTSSSSSYIGHPNDIYFMGGLIKSDDIKALLQNAEPYIYDRKLLPKDLNPSLFETTIAYINRKVPPYMETPLYKALKGNNYRLRQPVIVQIEVSDAMVYPNGIKIPGVLGEFDICDYFNPERRLKVDFFVNGTLRQTNYSGNSNPTVIDMVMGDSIGFKVTYYGNKSPELKGVPSVWIARFAGDLMYYCSPNTQPGEYNPWIGYDSRVHNMQLRSYSGNPNFSKNVAPWRQNGNIWEWGIVVGRRMDADKQRYNAPYTWIKYKILKDGSFQRNNQREGLNIQFLNYWQNGLNSDYTEYSGSTKYMMGFDDDELFYMNSQYYDAAVHPPLPGGGIAKLDSIPSRGMPEGYEQIYDVESGYPAQGFPLNIIVSAYKKNREWYDKHNSDYHDGYDGYEIQDIGTDEKHPFGDGTGNVAAPGIVKVFAGGKVVTFRLNVKSPLAVDYGMYGSIKGNTWPAYWEKNNKYTLVGLNGLSNEELNKYHMVYEGADALGNLHQTEIYLKDLTDSQKEEISKTGEWNVSFDNDFPTYACVSAYYQREPTYSPVIIAGKELKSIFLLFFGESELEGKGLGAKIWLNDFRMTKSGLYTQPRKFGNRTLYMTPFVRTYTFPTNTTTTFEAWDGDPHLFYDSGVEWFLSSRTLAERIPDSYLDGTAPGIKEPYLRYYINGIEQTSGRSGKKFTYKWTTPGEYELKVVYRTDGGLTAYKHKIFIVDYPKFEGVSQLGKIECRKLTAQESKWLNLKETDRYRVFEVKNIYSEYEYKDGPRACVPYINRWADHNDFASQFKWTMPPIPEVGGFIQGYSNLDWFWKYWALHYSSNWRDKLPNGLPPYVPDSLVTRIVGSELDIFASQLSALFSPLEYAKWQKTIPLVSYTDYQGDRMRTNPSCIYDLNYMWNNSNGAFSGNPILPPDASYIQAPDISDEQKDRQEFYYGLKSGRVTVVDIDGLGDFTIGVANTYITTDMVTGSVISTNNKIAYYKFNL